MIHQRPQSGRGQTRNAAEELPGRLWGPSSRRSRKVPPGRGVASHAPSAAALCPAEREAPLWLPFPTLALFCISPESHSLSRVSQTW